MADRAADADGFASVLPHHPVKLGVFEGPLDLLLHLVRTNEVDIHDIPIAHITEQYLEYLDLMQELDLDVAGEFLLMAATLIRLKARSLIPRTRPEDGEEGDRMDDRDALVERLLEHQRYRAAAGALQDREALRRAQWTRADGRVSTPEEMPAPALEVDMFSLLQAFQAVLARSRSRPQVPLPARVVSIEKRIEQLLARLSEREAWGFEELFAADATRAELITSFLALLEMIRLMLIRVVQIDGLGPIRVYRRTRPAGAPAPSSAAN